MLCFSAKCPLPNSESWPQSTNSPLFHRWRLYKPELVKKNDSQLNSRWNVHAETLSLRLIQKISLRLLDNLEWDFCNISAITVTTLTVHFSWLQTELRRRKWDYVPISIPKERLEKNLGKKLRISPFPGCYLTHSPMFFTTPARRAEGEIT
jgi:hypothetical protein